MKKEFFFYLFLILLFLDNKINVHCVEDYTIYDTSAKYPRPLLLSNNEILALSGETGTMTVLNSNGEIIREKQNLGFNYGSNACVRELKQIGKYVVSSGGDVKIVVFDRSNNYVTNTGKTSTGFFINITPLLDGNILVNYINGKTVYLTKWTLDTSTFKFTENTDISYSFTTTNQYITCIEFPSTLNILCTYVEGNCNDSYIYFSPNLSKKSTLTMYEKGGCAFDKVINMQGNTFVVCYLKNGDGNKYFCNFGEEISDGNIKLHLWNTKVVGTSCLSDAQKLDLAYFKDFVYVTTCVNKNNKNQIIVMTVTISQSDSTYSMSVDTVNIDSTEVVDYPFITKFSNDFLSIFYERGNNNVYQIPGFANCKDYTTNDIFINSKTLSFSLQDYITNGAGDTSTLYLIFISLSDEGTLYQSDGTTAISLTNNYLPSSTFIFSSNSVSGTYTIKFAGKNMSGIGKYCMITILVKACYTGCKTCTEYGTESENQCDECLDGYYPIENKEKSCAKDPLGYVLNNKAYKPCYSSCNTCTDIGNSNEHYCSSCKTGYFPIYNHTSICIEETVGKDGYYLGTDSATGEKKFYGCSENCLKCSEGPTTSTQNCDECITDFYFLDGTKNCLSSPEGYYLDETDQNSKIYKECYSTCKTCIGKGSSSAHNCSECKESYHKVDNNCNSDCSQSEYTQDKSCVTSCNENYVTDEEKKECVNCKGIYKYKYKGKCITENEKPSNTYVSDTDYNILSECDNECATCSEASTTLSKKCTSCNNNFYLLEGNCVSSCGDNYYRDDLSKKCINCYKRGQYKKENENACISSIPPQYYLEPSNEYGIVKKCKNECKSCTDINKCTSCIENYLLSYGECLTCEKTFYYNTDLKQCENCKEKSPESYKFIDKNECEYPRPTNTYVSNKTYNILEYCYQTCETCSKGGNSTNHNCDSCILGYTLNPAKDGVCVIDCRQNSHLWYLDSNKEVICVTTKKCPEKYPLLVEESSQCVESCKGPSSCIKCQTDYLFEYNGSCISQCPQDTLVDSINQKCVKNDKCIKTDIISPTYSSINNVSHDLDSILSNYITSHPTTDNYVDVITTADSKATIRIFKSDQCSYSVSQEYNYIYANFSECENIITSNSLLSNKDLIFVLVEIEREGQTTKQLDYKIFDSTGAEINMDICKGTTVNIEYPLNITDKDYYQLAHQLYTKGYDIFDPKDPFYNDFCTPYYTDDGKDVILIDRRENYFKNISLCEEGCSYTSVDFKTAKVKCSCEPKSSFLDTINDNIPEDSFLNDVSISNLIVVRCYNLVFNWAYAKKNLGNWILISLFVFQFFFLIIFVLVGLKQIYAYLNQYTPVGINRLDFCKPNPKIKSKLQRNNIIVSEDVNEVYEKGSPDDLLRFKGKSDGSASQPPALWLNDQNYLTKSKETSVTSERVDLKIKKYKNEYSRTSTQKFSLSNKTEPTAKEKEEEFEDDELDELVYEDALQYDKRNCCVILWRIMKAKLVVLSICSEDSVFEPLSVKLTAFTLNLGFYFALNCALYSDSYISERFKTTEATDFFYIIKNEIEKSIYVSLACSAINLLIDYILSGKKRFMTLIKTKQYTPDYLPESRKVLSSFKKKLFWFYFITIILFGFFWYYVSAFCAVYQASQKSWLESSIISFVFCIILETFYSVIIFLLRMIGLKCHISCVYTLSKYLL